MKTFFLVLITIVVYSFLNGHLFADTKNNNVIKQTDKFKPGSQEFEQQIKFIIKLQTNEHKIQKRKGLLINENSFWILDIYKVYIQFKKVLDSENLNLLYSFLNFYSEYTKSNLFRIRLERYINSKLDNKSLSSKTKKLLSIIDFFPKFKTNHRLLLFCYANSKGKFQQSKIITIIAEHLNYNKLASPIKNKINSVIQNDDILIKHLKSQLKYKNYSYLLKLLPQKIKKSKKVNSLHLNTLEKMYITVLTKKRFYSKLNNMLTSGKYFTTIAKQQSFIVQAGLLLKKGNVGGVKKIIKNKSITPEIRSHLNVKIGDYYYSKSRYSKSIYYYDRVDYKYIKNKNESELKWRIAFSLMRRGTKKGNSSLESIFEWADKNELEELEDAARFCYWKFNYIDGLKRQQRLNCFKKYPNTYYGLRAFVENNNKGQKKHFLNTKKYWKEGINIVALVQMLKKMYLNEQVDLAEYIIRRLIYENKGLMSDFNGLFDLLNEEKQYNLLIKLIYFHFSHLELIGSKHLYNTVMKFDYPLAYQSIVKRNQISKALPANLIYAVIREESKMRPEVKSWAGAVGLMQIMPRTAKYLNKFLKLKGKLDLKKPNQNIEIGSFYLKRLLKRYKGNIYHTLAAYNAGPTNANRWIKNQENNQFFLESISFSETRNYIKRVLKTYYIYQIIYEN